MGTDIGGNEARGLDGIGLEDIGIYKGMGCLFLAAVPSPVDFLGEHYIPVSQGCQLIKCTDFHKWDENATSLTAIRQS